MSKPFIVLLERVLLILVITIVLTLLFGCGSAERKNPFDCIDIEDIFLKYTWKWNSYAKVQSSTPICMGKTSEATGGGRVVGYCDQYSDGKYYYNQIIIDRAFWEVASEATRMSLIFHELGHCELHLEHTSSMLVDGCPVDLMYPVLYGNCFDKHYDLYINEMFGR